MSGTTWTRWFFSDWMSDPGVRLSSYAARGLWKDMLCIAADAKGFVAIAGRPLDAAGIAKATGGTTAEVETLLAELQKNGVFSRDRRGAIYCRRMVKAEKNRSNGRLAGPDKLRNLKQNQNSLGKTPEPPIPESRIQKPERKEEPPPTAALFPEDEWPRDAWDQFWQLYPHKVGKADARKSFDRVRKRRAVRFDPMMAGLRRYVAKTDDRPWCNPTTWLNQERWEDEPGIQPPRNGNGHARAAPPRTEWQRQADESAQVLRSIRERNDGRQSDGSLRGVDAGAVPKLLGS